MNFIWTVDAMLQVCKSKQKLLIITSKSSKIDYNESFIGSWKESELISLACSFPSRNRKTFFVFFNNSRTIFIGIGSYLTNFRKIVTTKRRELLQTSVWVTKTVLQYYIAQFYFIRCFTNHKSILVSDFHHQIAISSIK